MTVIAERASQPAWTAIKLRAWLLYFAAALFVGFAVFPLYMMFTTSVKTDQETFAWFVGQEREEKGEEPPQPFHLFRVEVDEIVLTTLGGDPPDHLVIETWRERRGTTRVERR